MTESTHRQVLADPVFEYIACSSQGQELAQSLRRLEYEAQVDGMVGIDTETTGLDPRTNRVRLVTVATGQYALIVDLFAWSENGAVPIDWTQPGLKELQAFFASDITKVLQNAAFDYTFLLSEGAPLALPIFDTMFASKIVGNGSGGKNDLGSIIHRVLEVSIDKELQKSDWSQLELTPEQLKYAARDAIALPRLRTELEQQLREAKVGEKASLYDIYSLEMKCFVPITMMGFHGMAFDDDAAVALEEKLKAEDEGKKLAFCEHIDALIRARFPDDPSQWLPRETDGTINTREKTSGSIRLGTKVYAGFNPRSPKQMIAAFLRAGVQLSPGEKGEPSLDQNLLAFMRNELPIIDEYMNWREIATRVSDTQKLRRAVSPATGRIHPGYRQLGTDTGRLSCAEPNLQNVPRGEMFRQLFVASPGYSILDADFSQIELRCCAEIADEPRMIEAYLAGRDLHTETAALIADVPHDEVTKEQRLAGKIANFALLYGAGPATLRKQAVSQFRVDMSFEEAQEIVSGFRKAYPKLYAWQTREGNATTKAVFSRYGRRRLLVGFNDKYTTRLNTRVQSTAGDIAKIAIAMLWKTLSKVKASEARLIGMVHDELIMEVRHGSEEHWAAALTSAMERAGAVVLTRVPVVAEAHWGSSWAAAK
jgi:DNA polymerase-1